tara:strand:+ start:267 stop:1094 length:828 start_codon:yes stop_codon:yes gene_type:complete
MAIWEEIKDGSTTFRRPRAKATGDSDRTASELRDVAVRGLLGKLPGNWPIIADIGMHIMGPTTDAALAKGKKYLGDVVGGYWKRMGEEPARATYGRLTEKGEPSVQKPSRDVDPFFNPDNNVRRKGTGFINKQGWRSGFYENPEMTASVVGATTAAAPLIAGGLFLDAFAKGQKPRSDYAYPVEPTRGSYDETGGVSASSNTYNPSVESARASAQFKHELEEQKQRHKIELMRMRGESHTPGVQNYGVGGDGLMDSGAIVNLLQNEYGSTRNYFK